MRFIKNNPRKSLILGTYFFIFAFFGYMVPVTAPVLAVLYLLATLVLFGIFFYDCVAMYGNLLYGRGQADKGAQVLRFAIKHNTKSPAAHLNYSIYLLRRGGAAEASGYLDKALTLNPKIITHKNLLLTKASCLWVLGDVDGAITVLENMRTLFDYVNAQALSTLGYMYFLKDRIAEAETLTQAALEDTPTSAAAWDNLGQIRFKQKKLAEAREAFEKALEFKADLPDSHFYLGLIAKAEGDTSRAQACFKRAKECPITPLNTVTPEQIAAEL